MFHSIVELSIEKMVIFHSIVELSIEKTVIFHSIVELSIFHSIIMAVYQRVPLSIQTPSRPWWETLRSRQFHLLGRLPSRKFPARLQWLLETVPGSIPTGWCHPTVYISWLEFTLWQFNITMENIGKSPFVVDLPIRRADFPQLCQITRGYALLQNAIWSHWLFWK